MEACGAPIRGALQRTVAEAGDSVYRGACRSGAEAGRTDKGGAVARPLDDAEAKGRRGGDEGGDVLGDALVGVVDALHVDDAVVRVAAEEGGAEDVGEVRAPGEDEALLDKVLQREEGHRGRDDRHVMPHRFVKLVCRERRGWAGAPLGAGRNPPEHPAAFNTTGRATSTCAYTRMDQCGAGHAGWARADASV